METAFPILLGGHDGLAPLSDETYRRVAREHKTFLLEDLWEAFRGSARGARHLLPGIREHPGAIERLKHEATTPCRRRRAARAFATAPPTRATAATSIRTWHSAAVDLALREHFIESGETTCAAAAALVLRSARSAMSTT